MGGCYGLQANSILVYKQIFNLFKMNFFIFFKEDEKLFCLHITCSLAWCPIHLSLYLVSRKKDKNFKITTIHCNLLKTILYNFYEITVDYYNSDIHIMYHDIKRTLLKLS